MRQFAKEEVDKWTIFIASVTKINESDKKLIWSI